MIKVAVIFSPSEKTPNNENVDIEQVELICQILNENNFEAKSTIYNPVTLPLFIDEFKPNVIFNLTYGFVDESLQIYEDQPLSTKRIESYGIPMVGSSALVQEICQNKSIANNYLKSKGINTPKEVAIGNLSENIDYIIKKPKKGANHKNVSLIHINELDKFNFIGSDTIEYIYESYCDGKEFSVAVVEINGELNSFSPLEIVFDISSNNPPIKKGNKSTWKTLMHQDDSYNLGAIAKKAFAILNMQHYARFDFRVTQEGPILLETNSLPNIHPIKSYLPQICNFNGFSYSSLILCLVKAGLNHGL
jgi:D-alanine-D-alanine ligase-like ATP-grasp enzyme